MKPIEQRIACAKGEILNAMATISTEHDLSATVMEGVLADILSEVKSQSTDSLLRLFNRINEDGQTILMVTHSTKAASHANRVLFIKDGQVFHQIYRGNLTNDELYVKIQDALMLITTGGEKHE